MDIFPKLEILYLDREDCSHIIFEKHKTKNSVAKDVRHPFHAYENEFHAVCSHLAGEMGGIEI